MISILPSFCWSDIIVEDHYGRLRVNPEASSSEVIHSPRNWRVSRMWPLVTLESRRVDCCVFFSLVVKHWGYPCLEAEALHLAQNLVHTDHTCHRRVKEKIMCHSMPLSCRLSKHIKSDVRKCGNKIWGNPKLRRSLTNWRCIISIFLSLVYVCIR